MQYFFGEMLVFAILFFKILANDMVRFNFWGTFFNLLTNMSGQTGERKYISNARICPLISPGCLPPDTNGTVYIPTEPLPENLE